MKKILLIEDDVDLFALLKYNLEKEGFSLTGLQTGRGAIELCRQVRPDLILLDIMLPDSDGLDICKGIRKDPDQILRNGGDIRWFRCRGTTPALMPRGPANVCQPSPNGNTRRGED